MAWTLTIVPRCYEMKLASSVFFLLVIILLLFPNADVATGSSKGLFPVPVKGKWGYIDKRGKVVIEPQFIKARDFRKGLSPVKVYAQ